MADGEAAGALGGLLEGQIDEWLARRPAPGADADADPRELASFLVYTLLRVHPERPHLPPGHAAVQFQGLEVDWLRGPGGRRGEEIFANIPLRSPGWPVM